jgi:hypothetical protein
MRARVACRPSGKCYFNVNENPLMSTARRILALLIAVSLAMLPAAGHAGIAVVTADAVAMDQSMHHMHDMAAMDDMDCCPHKSHPAGKSVDDCATMAGCVLCVGFLGAVSSEIASPLLLTSSTSPFAGTPLDSHGGSPPFRPPRS